MDMKRLSAGDRIILKRIMYRW